MEKLLEIYGNKIITNVKEYYTDTYYYFYNRSKEVFGINKSISVKEYELLKLSYQEKKIYNRSTLVQSIYEYIYESSIYPFLSKRCRFFIFEQDRQTNDTTEDMLKEIYQDIIMIDYKDLKVAFYFNHFDIPIDDLFASLSEDFAKDIYVHIGPYFDKNTRGEEILTYISSFQMANCRFKGNSDVTDLIFETGVSDFSKLITTIHHLVLQPIINKSEYMDLIVRLFKNDLNVSKTSKDLYLNRNSILARLDSIQKEIGINLQKFNGACAVKMLLSVKNSKK